jgi:hypothetical protein
MLELFQRLKGPSVDSGMALNVYRCVMKIYAMDVSNSLKHQTVDLYIFEYLAIGLLVCPTSTDRPLNHSNIYR